MPAEPLSTPFESSSDTRGSRRLSRVVARLGAPFCTLIFACCVSLMSLGLTALVLPYGDTPIADVFWISLLAPLPLAVLMGGLVFSLVIALERSRMHLDRLAMTDPLTGVSNRRRFLQSAQREIDLAHRHHLPLALLMLDIDRFKTINDSHGHAIGDQVLVEVGRRCRRVLRTTDLLARWGGEEFVILLPNTPSDHAHQLAERLRQAVAMSHQLLVQQQPVWITVSIGAAGIAPGEAATLDALLQTADEAMYHAKNSGRDQVFSAAWAAKRSGARA
jgi:diguanylate cyclase (GGDEF)-like protein